MEVEVCPPGTVDISSGSKSSKGGGVASTKSDKEGGVASTKSNKEGGVASSKSDKEGGVASSKSDKGAKSSKSSPTPLECIPIVPPPTPETVPPQPAPPVPESMAPTPFEIMTMEPTEGSTPTVSKETTGPPTLPLRGGVF